MAKKESEIWFCEWGNIVVGDALGNQFLIDSAAKAKYFGFTDEAIAKMKFTNKLSDDNGKS